MLSHYLWLIGLPITGPWFDVERYFFHMIFLMCGTQLAKMNENKTDKRYRYPESFILVIGHIRLCFHLPYRQTEGIVRVTSKRLPNHPSYSQTNRRVNK